jgi:hypothetical protein
MKPLPSTPLVALGLVLACSPLDRARAAAVLRSVGGDAAVASITAMRDQLRVDLGGGTIAGADGSFGGLRREINWDGVPAASDAPNLLPPDFFNTTSKRGVIFSTQGTGFEVSSATTDNGAGQPAPVKFGDINAAYSATFGVFSGQRIFTARNSNIMDVTFFVPGTSTPTTVTGFGAVFTDVDFANATALQFFDANNVSIGTPFFVPVGTVANQSLSFLGVSFNAGERVGRVRIFTGNTALSSTASENGGTDVVAIDDFIYSEPVPEPSALLLSASALLLALRRPARRRG